LNLLLINTLHTFPAGKKYAKPRSPSAQIMTEARYHLKAGQKKRSGVQKYSSIVTDFWIGFLPLFSFELIGIISL